MAERVTVEHNGERITLEVPDGTSDADIQKYLSGSKPEPKSTGPRPDIDPAAAVIQTALPAGVTPGPTGLQQLGQNAVQVARPMMSNVADVARGVGRSYVQAPVKGVIDLGAAAMGFPPPYAATESAMSLYDKYKAAKQGVSEASKLLSNTPGNPANYFAMGKAVPEAASILKDLYDNKGGPNAIKAWLNSPEASQYMNNPAFREAADAYMGKVPSTMQQVGKVVGPLARGAGRVLGPAGMAMNMYDASQYAEASKLGERLAQGEGGMAQQNFRNQNVPYGSGFTNTMTPDQAQAVLESGNERDITAFGGRDKLNELIRLKAAERVLGPVAPQGM
jgi:hypothetical protein